MLQLQGYNLNITYKKGKDIVLADNLSRAYLEYTLSAKDEFEFVNTVQYLPIRKERMNKLTERTSTDEKLQV